MKWLVLLLLLLPSVAALDEVKTSQSLDVAIEVLNISSGSVAVCGATCYLSIYHPAMNSSNWTYVQMSEVLDGSGTYNVTTPALSYSGLNRFVYNCTANGVVYTSSELVFVQDTLTNESLAEYNRTLGLSVANVAASVWAVATRTVTAIDWNSFTNWQTYDSHLVSVNDTVKAVGSNLSAVNASIYGQVLIAISRSEQVGTNLSLVNASVYSRMNDVNASLSARMIDLLAVSQLLGTNLSLVNSSIYLHGDAAWAASLVNVNVAENNRTTSLLLLAMNSTQNYATQQNVTDILNKPSSSASEGMRLSAFAPATAYTSENLTVDVVSVNSTSGLPVEPLSMNMTMYDENDSQVYSSDSYAKRQDGTFRFTTGANMSTGIYHVIVTAKYNGLNSTSATNPVRVAIPGSFDFSVDADAVGVIGYPVSYRVTARILRGQPEYEATISCAVVGMEGTTTSWNVMVFQNDTYTSPDVQVQLPKNLEKKHYIVRCSLGYVDEGVSTVIVAEDNFLAHERGTNLSEFIIIRSIPPYMRYPVLVLFLALLFGIIILYNRRKRKAHEVSEA